MFSYEKSADGRDDYDQAYEGDGNRENTSHSDTEKTTPDGSYHQSQNDDIQTVKENLMEKAQQIIEQLNEKREKDGEVIQEWKEVIRSQIEKHFETLEQAVQDIYMETSRLIEKQFKQLTSNVYRVERMQKEIEDLKSTLDEE